MNSDSNSEISSTEMTITGMTLNSLPENPGTKNSGVNAATVVSTENTTGTPTSLVPPIAASR